MTEGLIIRSGVEVYPSPHIPIGYKWLAWPKVFISSEDYQVIRKMPVEAIIPFLDSLKKMGQ